MEKLISIQNFNVLKPIIKDSNVRHSIRLICVFGFKGSQLIYATKEDNVYGFGNNRFGCLGVGSWDEDIPEPRLIEALSGKRLVSIYYGFGHCIGLNSDGQCYSWGGNEMGQLGIGSFESTNTPKLIRGLSKVVDISCGNRHTLALTSDGQVYGWGRNTFGQVGDGTWVWRWFPTKVLINEYVIAISCGKCHSLALTVTGQVYLWGLNEFGQLGRHRSEDLVPGKERPFCETPKQIPGFKGISMRKAVCGPNHTLFLTTDGHIYSCGVNEKGQIGNGSYETQYTPIAIRSDIEFKDIVCFYDNEITIAVSRMDRYFIWGFSHRQNVCSPLDMTYWVKTYDSSLVDIYARFSKTHKTYKTVVIHDINESKLGFNQTIASNDRQNNVLSVGKDIQSVDTSEVVTKPSDSEHDSIPVNVFHKHLSEAFNNEDNYDLKFVFKGKAIHCHKIIIELRNEKFWQRIEEIFKIIEQNVNQIEIKDYSYEAFYAFIQYLYGFEPKINDKISKELSQLADVYEEPALKYLCSQSTESAIGLHNICTLYVKAINDNKTDLKRNCIEFSQNNWKSIIKSQEFEEMNENIAKEFMKSMTH